MNTRAEPAASAASTPSCLNCAASAYTFPLASPRGRIPRHRSGRYVRMQGPD